MVPGLKSAGMALALIIAGPVCAQEPEPQASPEDSFEIASQIADVARCLVSASGDVGALAVAPGGEGSVVPLERITATRCPTEVFRQLPQPYHLRGAIAERLLLRDFAAIGAAPRQATAPIFEAPRAEEIRAASAYVRIAHAMLALGGCVAEAEPAGTYALFGTRIGSSGERAAMQALMPALAGCIPEGEEITLTIRRLRPFLAEAAYRAAVLIAQRPAAQ